jgi:hypothetical protein
MIQTITIKITPEILALIARIDEFKGTSIKPTGGNRNTLKQHFRALVERGNLNQQGSGRGVWYELR